MIISFNSSAQSHNKGEERQGPPNVDEIFEKMDADKNNLLEESEVKGPLKENFSTIDADSDGFITKEELENAPKPERKSKKGPR